MKALLLCLFWSLWYINFSTRTVLSPLLPIIEDELTIDHALAGSIFSFLSIGYTASLLLSGVLAPRIGYKRCIMLGFVILTISVLCLRYTLSYAYLLVVSVFVGLGAGIYLPCAIPLLTSIFDKNDWGKAIASHDTAASFSILSVPLLTAVALRFVQWRDFFAILGTACLIVATSFILLSPDAQARQEKKTGFLRIIRRRDFWIIAVLWIFAAANGLGLYNVIPLFLVKGNDMALQSANLVFGLSRVGGLFVAILAGFLTDRFGVKRVLFWFLLATGISTACLAFAHPAKILVSVLIVQATVSTGFFPVALVAISKLTAFHERSAFTGATIAVGVVFGLGLTPAALGAVADMWSFGVGFFVLGFLTILSPLLLKNIENV